MRTFTLTKAVPMRAKFMCHSETRYAFDTREYALGAVVDSSDANKSWAKSTPAGQLKITISNPECQSLIPGKCYFLDISLAPEPAN